MSFNYFLQFQRLTLKYPTQKDIIEKLYLNGIIRSYNNINQTEGNCELKENEIRNKFIYDFKYHNTDFEKLINNKILYFASENQTVKEDGTIYRTDIEFIISSFGLFTIECKKLKSAESRYINDGISRFTDLKYSEKEEYAGMIGFVCSGHISKIVNNLKPKVRAFCFANDSDNVLNKKCVDWEFSFQSKHLRTDGSIIHLYHLFFDFSENTINERNIIIVK
jgi:hypothetical protein